MKTPQVYIIILNWNGLNDTLECLESVYKLDYSNFKVVVVDNGSSDNCPEIIYKRYPKIKLIKNEGNYGYTGGNNIGMRYALGENADYVWLLNNDTVVYPDCLSKIIETAESSKKIGLVSPMIYYFESPDQCQFAGSCIDWGLFTVMYPETNDLVRNEYQRGENVCLWGTALLIKRKLIEKIGLLKEGYFAYYEDTEYSLRSLVNNFKNVVCIEARVLHKGQMQFTVSRMKRKNYYIRRNVVLLGNEYIKDSVARLKFKVRSLATAADLVNRFPGDYEDAYLDGTWHGLKSVTGPMTSDRNMPIFLKRTLKILSKYHPMFISDIITFDFSMIWRKVKNKLKIVE